MVSEQQVNDAIDTYANMVKRICMVHLKNEADTQDIFQEVFLRYARFAPVFQTKEHEKAWLIRVTINACKDLLRNFFRSHTTPLEEARSCAAEENEEQREVLQAVLSLPQKYRDVIYLHYYEGYTAVEIGGFLHKNENTVYSHLTRGRGLLKNILGGEDVE